MGANPTLTMPTARATRAKRVVRVAGEDEVVMVCSRVAG